MTEQEAIAALDELNSGDNELDHHKADEILLAYVPAEVRDAWERARDRSGGFWYA